MAFRLGICDPKVKPHATRARGKMSGVINGWQKVKFDRMIVAIAAVTGCGVIYSDDPDLRKLAGPSGPQVISLAQLPVPPIPAQSALDFEGGAES